MVLDNLDLARTIARLIRTDRLSYDERRSAAVFGLIRAAGRYRPGIASYRTYAAREARFEIFAEIGKARSWRTRRPSCGHDEGRFIAELDTRDELRALVLHRLYSLSARQREVITLYLDGFRWCEMAPVLGIDPKTAERYGRDAIVKLRKSPQDSRES